MKHQNWQRVQSNTPLRVAGRGKIWREARARRLLTLVVVIFLGVPFSRILPAQNTKNPDAAELLSKENSVDTTGPAAAWRPASVGQKLIWHDRLRTGEDSRAAVRMSDSSVLRIDELTETEILPPQVASAKPTVDLKQGSAYFFSREKAREIHVQTPAANGAIRGTEFVVTVATNGYTSFTMLDGEVEVSNPQGSLVVRTGERADIEPGRKPTKTAVINAINSAEWCLYYPGVLDPNELRVTGEERDAVRASLTAYSEGDLLGALTQYPGDRLPASPEEKVYRAGLFLVVGQVPKAERLLREVNQDAPGHQALSTLIAAVTLKEKESAGPPRTASDWVAESYYLQSKANLAGALEAAQRATATNPTFGFAWTRVAELEFSFGRVPQAKKALEKGLTLAPRNPAAHALRGFLLSAEGNINDAKDSFERAMTLDGALGDAWLGHGLCLIRQGHDEAGRRDLLTAAALEPNRVIFRGHLGKAFSNVGSEATTRKERTPRPEITVGPTPYYPERTPGPKITARPRPSHPEGTARPKITTNPTPHRPKPTQRPTHPERPQQAQQDRRPEQAQPSRGASVPEAQAGQQQAKGKKQKPTEGQSPTPY
jgi:ferric-dicitrate binding protein FerR (iron transport regulator)